MPKEELYKDRGTPMDRGYGANRPKKSEDVLRKDGIDESIVLYGSTAATSSNYGTFYTAKLPVEIAKVQVRYRVASTSGTLQIERLDDGTAEGSGDNILNTAIDLSGTANNVIEVSQRDMTSERILKEGQSLALVDGGTLTNLEQLLVSIYMKPVGNGHYR